MGGLKNRRTAALAMCVMIFLSFIIGGWRSGARLYGEVGDIFYNGEKGNGIGVASDLSQRAESAVNMIIVAKRGLEADDDVLKELEAAVTAMNSAGSLEDKAEANSVLTSAMAAVYDALGEVSLSEKDEGYRQSLYADFTSAAMTMSHDGYNEQAVEYNRAIKSFPGSIFFAIFGYGEVPVFR